jgi:hypothetical protein
MPLFNSQQQSDRSSGWLEIAAIVVVEILVLLALCFRGGSLRGMVIRRRSSRIYEDHHAIGV